MRRPELARPPGARLALAVSAAVLVAGAALGCGSDPAPEPAPPPTRAEQRTAPTQPLLPAAAGAELARIADAAGGRLGVAVAPPGGGPVEVAGDLTTGTAWSTMKAPLLVALVRSAGGWDELSPAEQQQAALAIERSDNEAALALFERLAELEGGAGAASAAIERVLRDGGDSATDVNTEPNDQGFSTFGQTRWSAAASASFMQALAATCLLGASDTSWVISLMGEVVADQRWGIGDAGYPVDDPLAFKGGWGPEPAGGYLVRQIGSVGGGAKGLVVSIIATAPGAEPAAFAAARQLVTEAARWIQEAVGTAPSGRPAACASAG
jgi:hypothetical protein